jgi:peptidyl-prolyl cis-trans isomerase C
MARPSVRLNGVTLPPQMIAAEAQHHPARSPAAAFEAAAQALIVRILLLEEAARRGLKAEPQEVADGKRELPDEAQIRLLLDCCVPIPDIGEAECLACYQEGRERFRSPDLVEVSHILFAADPRETGSAGPAQAAAEEALSELRRQPAAFEAIARSRSDCGSKSAGGRLGQLSPGDTVPEFEDALATLQPGEITSAPVRSRFGFHIIRLDARQAGQPLPFEYVQEKIAALLAERAWRRNVADFIESLVQGAEIEGVTMHSRNGMAA